MASSKRQGLLASGNREKRETVSVPLIMRWNGLRRLNQAGQVIRNFCLSLAGSIRGVSFNPGELSSPVLSRDRRSRERRDSITRLMSSRAAWRIVTHDDARDASEDKSRFPSLFRLPWECHPMHRAFPESCYYVAVARPRK